MNFVAFYRYLQIFKVYFYRLINLQYYSVVDLQGRIGELNGDKLTLDSYYVYGLYPRSEGRPIKMVWKSSQAKTGHNGITVHSPTVPWNGTQAGLSAYLAGTGETDPSGTGCWVAMRDEIDVYMAGATGGNSADETAAFQAAINYITSISYSSFQAGARPALRVPAGYYKISSLTCSDAVHFKGGGLKATLLAQIAGTTTSMFICNVLDYVGTPQDSFSFYFFEDMNLIGNRTDTVYGSSHGIYCPDPGWTASTQYSSSIITNNVHVTGFTGDGIRLEANRNAAIINNTLIRYNNGAGFLGKAYDYMISNSQIGNNEMYGIYFVAGGSNTVENTTIYFNSINNVFLGAFVNSPCFFDNCAMDAAYNEAIKIQGFPTAMVHHVLKGCRFAVSSRAAANTYADIKVDHGRLSVIGCTFTLNTQAVKYLVESTANTSAIFWSANSYDTVTNVPYGTAVTNNFAKLIYSGDPLAFVGPYNGANSWCTVIGGAEIQRTEASRVTLFKDLFLSGTLPQLKFVDTDAAADNKTWIAVANSGVYKVQLQNDAGTVFADALSITRSGTTPGNVKSFGTLEGTGSIRVSGTQVLGTRITGWGADTGTAKRTANATYSGTAEGAYTQATIQTLMDAVRDLSQTQKALKDDLITHGVIGS